MQDNVRDQRTPTHGDSAILTALAARCGGEWPRRVALARSHPRARPALLPLVDDGRGAALLTHERVLLAGATLDVGHLHGIMCAPGAAPTCHEQAFDAALAALYEEGLPLIRLIDTPGRAPLGCAPCQFQSVLSLAHASTAGALRAATPEDSLELATLARTSTAGLSLVPVRSDAEWQHWIGHAAPRILTGRNGQIIAFAAEGEAGAEDAAAARALVQVLAAANQPIPHLPARHLVTQALLQLGGRVELFAAPPDTRTSLYGVVDLALLLEEMRAVLTVRVAQSRYAGWSGLVRLEADGGPVDLRVRGGAIAIAPPDVQVLPDIRIRQLRLHALPQLCLGYRSAPDLRAAGLLEADDPALSLLDVLFPVVAL